MKYAHMADCHIGAWRDPKLKDANMLAFEKAVDTSISKGADFILISGDLFNTALPPIDYLKRTVMKLKQLKEAGIYTYIIAGSHDFSASGKTMIDVLEEAGLVTNVVKGTAVGEKLQLKFTVDPKTGTKITGMLGRKLLLDKKYYDALDMEHLESEPGYKIFMFHTAISELRPKDLEKMDAEPVSILPRGFDYYAGGHVHIISKADLPDHKSVAYPGPLFPNSFKELEDLRTGGMYLVESINGTTKAEYLPIKIHNTVPLQVNCDGLSPELVLEKIDKMLKNKEFVDSIVTIRLIGTLASGKSSDIRLSDIFDTIYSKGAYFVMKSTTMLKSKEFEHIMISPETESDCDIEAPIIKEHAGQMIFPGKKDALSTVSAINMLMTSFWTSKREGEKIADFESRLKKEVESTLSALNSEK